MHKKYKSHTDLNKKEIIPSFRSVGKKPYDFHRLKHSTVYNGFPKIKSSSMDKERKEDLNLNLKQEVHEKKKIMSFQKKKSDIVIDKWKQKYGNST